ncbi:MAG: hypothetical protein ABSF48_22980 [Thermodesulfobacteriota bacterium]|jgi:hypothetical protein
MKSMNVGDRIKFSFGGNEKEGVVVKIFPKKVYLKVDFPKHPGRIVVRTLSELEGKNAPKKSKKREKAEKEKKAKKEKREKAQAAQEKKSEEEAEKEGGTRKDL